MSKIEIYNIISTCDLDTKQIETLYKLDTEAYTLDKPEITKILGFKPRAYIVKGSIFLKDHDEQMFIDDIIRDMLYNISKGANIKIDSIKVSIHKLIVIELSKEDDDKLMQANLDLRALVDENIQRIELHFS